MTERTIQLAPSLLAADFADLGAAVDALAGIVDVYHVDVMDGHFVPNISMGPAVLKGLRPRTDAALDVHLMVAEPGRWIAPYRDLGADWISVHHETADHLEGILAAIRASGARAGVALNPSNFPDGLEYVLRDGDFVLVMSVNPGFAGQSFLPSSIDKLAALRQRLDAAGLSGVQLQIDGGVDGSNAADVVAAGADILVAGSSVYGADDPQQSARDLLKKARSGLS